MDNTHLRHERGNSRAADAVRQHLKMPEVCPAPSLHTHYVMTVNATGEEFVEPFSGQVHGLVAGANIAHQGGITQDQAQLQIAIWNRSQAAHRQEFTYRLLRS